MLRVLQCEMTLPCHTGYKYLFDGCPRGGMASGAIKQGDYSLSDCEDLCDADSNCNGIEVNGCNSDPQCGGRCYLFYGTGSDIRNGGCVTNGDQKAYLKPGFCLYVIPSGLIWNARSSRVQTTWILTNSSKSRLVAHSRNIEETLNFLYREKH